MCFDTHHALNLKAKRIWWIKIQVSISITTDKFLIAASTLIHVVINLFHFFCLSFYLNGIARYMSDQQRFPPNTSNDSTRYASSSRSHSGSQTPILNAQQQTNAGGSNGNGNENIVNNPNNSISIGIGSNRNSYNINSNRSSMDVSTCSSYNTLIIHPDDTLHGPLNRLAAVAAAAERDHLPDAPGKKDRPHSYGEQGMQEITEIPDDYLNQSHVLKHLAKEMKIPSNRPRTSSRERSLIDSDKENTPKWVIVSEPSNNSKVKSKSQPDLTK